MPRKPDKPLEDVFLNIPYDNKFENLCLAYVSGVSAFGLNPRATLEIPGGMRRLDRIFHLIQSCAYSVHDLSRVELDRTRPRTPRFNMPFELGMCVAWAATGGGGTVAGVFRELCNAFVRSRRKPTIQQMWRVYRDVRKSLPRTLRRAGAKSIYNARVFKDKRGALLPFDGLNHYRRM